LILTFDLEYLEPYYLKDIEKHFGIINIAIVNTNYIKIYLQIKAF